MTLIKIYLLENRQWEDKTNEFCHPISQTFTLDESLDNGILHGKPIERKDLYPRLMPLKIVSRDLDENGFVVFEETEYYIASDQSDLCRTVSPYLYEHSFILTEPTRLLERYFISGMSFTQPLQGTGRSKSIAEVIERLLDTVQCIKCTESPRFHLDDRIRGKLSKINSCEFKWSCKMTLKECLKEIGKFIGAEPRLIPNAQDDRLYDTVTYDFYNKIGKDISNIKYTAYKEDCLEMHHHSSIETYAENIIAQGDENQASVTYPSKNSYVSTRADAVKYSDKDSCIILPNNIYKILKCYLKEVEFTVESENDHKKKKQIKINDMEISDGIFEYEKWQLLNEVTTFGWCKTNTIQYKQGENKIGGFNYSSGSILTTNTSLPNLIKRIAVSNYKIEGYIYLTVDTLPQDLQFRIEYIPLSPSRVSAMRGYNDTEGSFAYNQQAEYNDCRAIGRNMKNVVERLGSKEKQVVFQHSTVKETPRVGDTFEDYTINKVTRVYKANNLFETMFIATENESRLSEKISVNQKFRQWAIPADDIEKHLLRNEYCFIEEKKRINTSSAKTAFMKRFTNVFDRNQFDGITEVDCATVCGCDASGNADGYETVLASAQSSAIADSLKFTFRMKDNYSAGLKKDGDEIIDVPYAGSRGEAPAFRIAWGSELASGYDANSLPLCPNGLALSYLDGTFITYKDASERLAMTYQMHVLSKLKNVIVGCKLTENNPLVREWEKEKTFRFWKLTKPLSRFALLLTDEGEEVSGMSMTATVLSGGSIQLHISGIDTSGVGWAITDENGYLYLAENAINESVRDLYFNFASERR